MAAPAKPTGTGTIPAGTGLVAGDVFKSDGGRYELAMQSDGNLVLYDGGTAIWDTQTNGTDGYAAIMQGDGNFVLYGRKGNALWNSGTAGHPGAHLSIQTDGNLVVYLGSTALWDTHTNGR